MSRIVDLTMKKYALASTDDGKPLDGDPLTILSSCVHLETEYFAQFRKCGFARALCERLVESPTLTEEQQDAVLATLGCWLRDALARYKPTQPHWLDMINYATQLAERVSLRGCAAADAVLAALAAELVTTASLPHASPAELRSLLWAVDATLGRAARALRESMLPRLHEQLRELMSRCAYAGELHAQRALLRVLLRFVPCAAAARADVYLLLCPTALFADDALKLAFYNIDYGRFVPTSRKFLMVLNLTVRGVVMVLCQSAYIDDIRLHPLGGDADDSFWLELNLGPRTLTLEWNPAPLRESSARPLCANLLGEHATLTVSHDTLDCIEVTRDGDRLAMSVKARRLGVFADESPSQQVSVLTLYPTGDFEDADHTLREMFGYKYNCALSAEALVTPDAPTPRYVGAPLSDDKCEGSEEFKMAAPLGAPLSPKEKEELDPVAAGPRLGAVTSFRVGCNSLDLNRSLTGSQSSVSTTSLLNLRSKLEKMKKNTDVLWQVKKLELKRALDPFNEGILPAKTTYKGLSSPINQNIAEVSSVWKDQTEDLVNNLFLDALGKNKNNKESSEDPNREISNLPLPDNDNVVVASDIVQEPTIPENKASDCHVKQSGMVLSPRVLLERLEQKQITIVDQYSTERIASEKSNSAIHDMERNGNISGMNSQCEVSSSEIIPNTPNTMEVSFHNLSCIAMTTACTDIQPLNISPPMPITSSNTLDVKKVTTTIEKKNNRAPRKKASMARKKKIKGNKKMENFNANLEELSSNIANSDSLNLESILPDTSCKATKTGMQKKPVNPEMATNLKNPGIMITSKGAVCNISDSDDVTVCLKTPTEMKKKRKLYSPRDDLIVQSVNKTEFFSQDDEEMNFKNTVTEKKPSTDDLFDQIRDSCSNMLAGNLPPKDSLGIYNFSTDSEKDFQPCRFRSKRPVLEKNSAGVSCNVNKKKRIENKFPEVSRKRVSKKTVVKNKIDPEKNFKEVLQSKSALDDEKIRKVVLADAGLDTSLCFEKSVHIGNLAEDMVPIGLQNIEMEEMLQNCETPDNPKILRKNGDPVIVTRKPLLQGTIIDISCGNKTTRTHENSPFIKKKERKQKVIDILEAINIQNKEKCNAKKNKKLNSKECNLAKDVHFGQSKQVEKSVHISEGSGLHMDTIKENIETENTKNNKFKYNYINKNMSALGDSNVDYDEIITEMEYQTRINNGNGDAHTEIVEVNDIISPTCSDDGVLVMKAKNEKSVLFNEFTRKRGGPFKARTASHDNDKTFETIILDCTADEITRLHRSRAVKNNVACNNSNKVIDKKTKNTVSHKHRIPTLNANFASDSSDFMAHAEKIDNIGTSQDCYNFPRKYRSKITTAVSSSKIVKPKKNCHESEIEIAKANQMSIIKADRVNLNTRKTVKEKTAKKTKKLFEEMAESPLPPLVVEKDHNDGLSASFSSLADLIQNMDKHKKQNTFDVKETVLSVSSGNNNYATNIACSTPRDQTLKKQSCLTIDSSKKSACEKSIITDAYSPITGHGDFNESPPNVLHLEDSESGRHLENDLEKSEDRQYIHKLNCLDSSREIDDLENESSQGNRRMIKRQHLKRNGDHLFKDDISSNGSKFRKSVNLLKHTKTSFSPISNTSDVFFRVVKPVTFSPITKPISSSCSEFTTSNTNNIRFQSPQSENSTLYSQFLTKSNPLKTRNCSVNDERLNLSETSDQDSDLFTKCEPSKSRNHGINSKKVINIADRKDSYQDTEMFSKCGPSKTRNRSDYAERVYNGATDRESSNHDSEMFTKCGPSKTRSGSGNAKRVNNKATDRDDSYHDSEMFTKGEPSKTRNPRNNAKSVNAITADDKNCNKNNTKIENECTPLEGREAQSTVSDMHDLAMQAIEAGLIEADNVTHSVWVASITRMLRDWREFERRHKEAQLKVKREADRRLELLQSRAEAEAERTLERLKRELMSAERRRREGAELRVRLLREDLDALVRHYRRTRSSTRR